jgi:hypothetical protein
MLIGLNTFGSAVFAAPGISVKFTWKQLCVDDQIWIRLDSSGNTWVPPAKASTSWIEPDKDTATIRRC